MNTKTFKVTTSVEMLAAISQCLHECPVFQTNSINQKFFEIEIIGLGKIDVTAVSNDVTEADLVSRTIPTMDELKTCLDAMMEVGTTYIVQFGIANQAQTLQFERC